MGRSFFFRGIRFCLKSGQKIPVNNLRTKANKISWSVDRRFTRRLTRNLELVVHQKIVIISADALPQKGEEMPDLKGVFGVRVCRKPVNIGVSRRCLQKLSIFRPNSHCFLTAGVPRQKVVNKSRKNSISHASFRSKNLGNRPAIFTVNGQRRTVSALVFQHPSEKCRSRLPHARSRK